MSHATINLGAMFRTAWQRSRGSISLTLVWVCSGLFIGIALLDILCIVSRHTIVMFFALSYAGVVRHLWVHQLVTAPFLHAGLMHLLFNMLALWMLGPDIENRLGRRRYVTFSIVCAVCSMAGSLAFNWGTANVILGYSGVIFGILVAQAIFFPNRMIVVFWVFPMKMRYAVMVFAAIALYSMATPGTGGGIAHAAHLFGGVAGYFYLRPPQWLQRLTGMVPSASASSCGTPTKQPMAFRARSRLMVYRFREWKYRISQKFR